MHVQTCTKYVKICTSTCVREFQVVKNVLQTLILRSNSLHVCEIQSKHYLPPTHYKNFFSKCSQKLDKGIRANLRTNFVPKADCLLQDDRQIQLPVLNSSRWTNRYVQLLCIILYADTSLCSFHCKLRSQGQFSEFWNCKLSSCSIPII